MAYKNYWSGGREHQPSAPTQREQGSDGALTVSAALAIAKNSLESVTVRIIGEVSEVSVKPGYKAAYFTVKDQGGALPCMMWNNRYNASGVKLAIGQLVEISGRFTLYAAKGRMNFDVFSVALAGEGDLRMKVANIAKRLKAEGLTDPMRKRPLPEMPELIGLVTSPRSAAVHDVLRTLRRRFPIAKVLLAGVPVEGVNAPAGIVEGIRCVASAGAQVVLVVRGGGSFEDMMPFNDEGLARAIAACPVPVVTGIGHEVDTAIADMVSDFRASTPTAAAEAVSPSRESLDALFASRGTALTTGAMRALERCGTAIDRVSMRPVFVDPLLMFASEAQALDYAEERITRALPARVERERMALDQMDARISRLGPGLVQRFSYELATRASRLDDLSPVRTLARGYSVTRNEKGEVVRRTSEAPVGTKVEVTVSDGRLVCAVEDARNEPLLAEEEN